MNVLEKVFELSVYLLEKDNNEISLSTELVRDPWTMEYIPELFVSSEKLNIQIAQLIKCLAGGRVITAIAGELKSGKSFIMRLLADGLEEILYSWSKMKKIFVKLLTPEDFEEYSLTALLQKLSELVLGKYFQLKEQIIVELKRFSEENNVLIILLLDNFPNGILERVASDVTKIMKLLKNHFSAVIATHFKNILLCENGVKKCGIEHLGYVIHVPELTLSQTKTLILRRLQYGFDTKNVKITDVFSERAIEAAWVNSNGNPWVLISILADAYMISQKKKKRIVTVEEINSAASLFSRAPIQSFYEENDRFFIQQAINNFPYRERQVCELLMQKDATAKEITYHIYGNLSPTEYRSKYMGIKSFLKRLKEKNVVIVKGWEGRSIVFGLNPKMKGQLVQYEPAHPQVSDIEKIST